MTDRTHVVVIGGGIAGVSAAAFLAHRTSVTVVDMESTLTHHTTGRSAALLFENYGHANVRPLTRASKPFLANPPDDLVDGPLLADRGALSIGRDDQRNRLDELLDEGRSTGAEVEDLDEDAIRQICPAIRAGYAAGGVWEPGAADMDVAAIHQAFVRDLRRHDGQILREAEAIEFDLTSQVWRVTTRAGTVEADVVVDAAGAWGDVVAGRAGVEPIGLQPKRRTAFMVPGTENSSRWPLVVDADHDFYFKPDGSQILCSPADETPSEPCDARPVDIDIARAIDRINSATTLAVRTVRSAWAGLRTFAPDGGMVIGFDDVTPGFFWLVGQGGTGIQTAPGAGRLAADLILDGAPSEDLRAAGVDIEALSVSRLRNPGTSTTRG